MPITCRDIAKSGVLFNEENQLIISVAYIGNNLKSTMHQAIDDRDWLTTHIPIIIFVVNVINIVYHMDSIPTI